MEEQIRKFIQDTVNPVLDQHNGSCQLISVVDDKVTVRMLGGCKGCPGRQLTFLRGIRPMIMENCPGVKDVLLYAER